MVSRPYRLRSADVVLPAKRRQRCLALRAAGGFRAGKVVALEDEVVFLRLFAERWTTRPSRVEAHKVARATALAFSAQSFSSMQPVHLENGEVSPDELEAYETWKESKRDVF